MNWLLSFIPIVGKVFDYLNKKQDIDLEKFKVNGQIDEAQLQAYVASTQYRAKDWVDAFGRAGVIIPTCLWIGLIFYDSIFREILPDWATWRVLALPPNLEYVPYAVIGYLFLYVARR